MQVKVFEAADMASGLKLVRKELGPDALILSTRTVKNGKLGILGRQMLEITAAIDTDWPKPAAGKAASTTPRVEPTASGLPAVPVGPANAQETMTVTPIVKIGARDRIPGQPPEPSPPPAANAEIRMQHELEELKGMVKTLAGEIGRLGNNRPETGRAPSDNGLRQAMLRRKLQPPGQSRIPELLCAHGISPEVADTIAGFAGDRLSDVDLADDRALYPFLQKTMADILAISPPPFDRNDRQQRIAFIGPTGVGKTTTLAKIAAHYLGTHSPSVALITIDTYRIAAVEQLKVYGEIMHLPVDVVLTPEQLEQAVARHQDKDLILIDTAGRSPRDTFSIDELATFLHPGLDVANILVLSATTREEELTETVARFAPLAIDSVIFTKVDECTQLGIILNTQIHNGIPISYITNGQRVPEDLVPADRGLLAELILPNPEGRLHE